MRLRAWLEYFYFSLCRQSSFEVIPLPPLLFRRALHWFTWLPLEDSLDLHKEITHLDMVSQLCSWNVNMIVSLPLMWACYTDFIFTIMVNILVRLKGNFSCCITNLNCFILCNMLQRKYLIRMNIMGEWVKLQLETSTSHLPVLAQVLVTLFRTLFSNATETTGRLYQELQSLSTMWETRMEFLILLSLSSFLFKYIFLKVNHFSS